MGDSHLRKAYSLFAQSLERLGRTDEARQALLRGLEATPGDPEILFHMGRLSADRGDFEEARGFYRQVLGADIGGHFSSIDVGILGYKLYHNLAGVEMALGNYDEAKGWWLRALDRHPGNLPSMLALFAAAIGRGDIPVAREMLRAARDADGPGEVWAEMFLRYADLLGEGPAYVDQLERIALDERSVGAGLVLSRRLLEQGDADRALPHLVALEASGVAEAAYLSGVVRLRLGDFGAALASFEKARDLNPGHSETHRQIESLRRLIDSESV